MSLSKIGFRHFLQTYPLNYAEAGSHTLQPLNFLSFPSDLAVSQLRPCELDSLPLEQGVPSLSLGGRLALPDKQKDPPLQRVRGREDVMRLIYS